MSEHRRTECIVGSVSKDHAGRGVLTVITEPRKFSPDGIERFFIEAANGPEPSELGSRLGALTGARVAVIWEPVDTLDGGRRRVVRDVEVPAGRGQSRTAEGEPVSEQQTTLYAVVTHPSLKGGA